MPRLFFSTLLIATTIFFVQCKKEGSIGPAGPEGPRGETGATGNANVKVDTLRISNAQWLYNSNYLFDHVVNGWMWAVSRYHDRTFTSITQDILNTGMVLCYFTPSPAFNINNWILLNFRMTSPTGIFYYNVASEVSVGKVRFHYFYTPNDQGATLPNLRDAVIPTYRFKIVAVSGAIASGRMMSNGTNEKQFNFKGNIYTEAALKAMPYFELCKLLDINP